MHANHQSQHENKVTFHSVEGKKLGMTITQNMKPAFPFPFFNLPPLSIPPFFPPLPLLSPIISVLSILLSSRIFLPSFSTTSHPASPPLPHLLPPPSSPHLLFLHPILHRLYHIPLCIPGENSVLVRLKSVQFWNFWFKSVISNRSTAPFTRAYFKGF